MKLISLILILFITGIQSAQADENIYGPHGENLGPNPDMEQVFQDVRQKKELDALHSQYSQLQQRVQELESQKCQGNMPGQTHWWWEQIQISGLNNNNNNNKQPELELELML